jgi:fatty acid/phospholipid biosynthesis enzyme
MAYPVKLEGTDGSFMWIEVTPRTESEIELVAEEGGVAKAVTRLEDSLGSIRGAAVALMSSVAEMAERPDEVQLEIALSLGIEGGVIVARGSANASATVTLTWKAGEA